MKVANLYVITMVVALVLVDLTSFNSQIVKKVKEAYKTHTCQIEMVDVTKTEGDLTWTDTEQICK